MELNLEGTPIEYNLHLKLFKICQVFQNGLITKVNLVKKLVQPVL